MSPSRRNILFGAVALTFIGGVTVLSSLRAEESPVAHLPTVPSATPLAVPPLVAEKVPRLMRRPSLSATQIAFDFAGEIWTVPREGGDAKRLVTGQLLNTAPIFSPDGKTIAYTGGSEGTFDVYVVNASGGEARRLTYHPATDTAVGWTPDGSRVVFSSMRKTPRDLPKLFTVSVDGGPPEELPLPSGTTASYSPDGMRLAYVPFPQWQPEWRKYAGGQTSRIWLADLADSKITKIPQKEGSDRAPMWVGDSVYFLSDRNGPTTLFSYDLKGGQVRELVPNPNGFQVRSAAAGPGGIVFEKLGELHLYDIAQGKEHLVPVNIAADLPQVKPRFVRLSYGHIQHAALSPTGKRAVFEARGDIVTVPAEKGSVRNLTESPGVADRSPAWSPDGRWIAWLSDASGEYALYFRSPDGIGPVHKIDLGDPPSFFYAPNWSPDGKKIVLHDKRLKLWLVDLASAKLTEIDHGQYEGAFFNPSWSPDSKWIVYEKEQPNGSSALVVYSLDEKKTHQLTDGRSDAGWARFDKSGKYLWFLASTDVGMAMTSGMTAMGHAHTSALYAMVLRSDAPSPFAPESDDEDAGARAPGDGKPAPAHDEKKANAKDDKARSEVKIDFTDIDQRIVAAPVDHANYGMLEVGTEGVVFLSSGPIAASDDDYAESDDDTDAVREVVRFDLKSRKAERFLSGVAASVAGGGKPFHVSFDGKTVLFAKDEKWFIASADKPPKDGEGHLKIEEFELYVDPRADWREVYREVWRIERDFLYDPHFHGLDLAAAQKTYAPFVDGIAARDDLNALLGEALGNLVLGHVWSFGGAMPQIGSGRTGLLGCDYHIEDGRYRIARILHGENWNPHLKAPLTEPGVDVHEGDYLLAIDGHQLRADDDVSRLLQGRAGLQTVITVASRPIGGVTRDVTVVPVASEGRLRLRTWMEDNRKKVLELSKGRVGYVYLPDTEGEGFRNFNRYYFSETGKEGVVLDERFNHGGQIADYMVNVMTWVPLMGATTREGDDTLVPRSVFGAKVMIANEMSGSGGDALPWLFKRAKVGPLVGTRTWGGLVGIGGYPRLIDGGVVTAPRWGLYGVHGEWEVENHGVAPDVEVEQDPALMRQGHDPQLERAVELVLDALQKNPPPKIVRPPYPNYGARLPTY